MRLVAMLPRIWVISFKKIREIQEKKHPEPAPKSPPASKITKNQLKAIKNKEKEKKHPEPAPRSPLASKITKNQRKSEKITENQRKTPRASSKIPPWPPR